MSISLSDLSLRALATELAQKNFHRSEVTRVFCFFFLGIPLLLFAGIASMSLILPLSETGSLCGGT